jgi:hypothetical protein
MKPQFTITSDTTNQDIPEGMDVHQAREHYLKLYGTGFKSKMPPIASLVEKVGDKFVVRCDLAPAGFKAYGAEHLIASLKEDTLVYCAPRVGHAPEAICVLSKMYGKKAVFFVPASSEVSKHQAVLAAYGAELRFIRTAAMPMLNSYARKWAAKHGAVYLPFGLKGVPAVTAGIVKFAADIAAVHGEPPEFWCAVSTGTMIRGLQIGWPNAKACGVAVARNMHDGEIGRAQLTPAMVPFLKPVKPHELPAFPTTATYDAKAWTAFQQHAAPGAIFINVGSDAAIEKRYAEVDVSKIKSMREWRDLADFERGPTAELQVAH